jgi:hypothetical protein
MAMFIFELHIAIKIWQLMDDNFGTLILPRTLSSAVLLVTTLVAPIVMFVANLLGAPAGHYFRALQNIKFQRRANSIEDIWDQDNMMAFHRMISTYSWQRFVNG